MQRIITLALLFLIASCNSKVEKIQEDVYYTCSMDPQVRENKPGKCPICKMPLTPVKKEKAEHMEGLHLSDQQIQLGHIQTETLSEHEIGEEILLTGVLAVDKNKTSTLSSKVMGRIEKLYFKKVGEKIKVGETIYEIYSEDLNLAVRELKLALDKKKSLNMTSVNIDRIISSEKNKLRLYGLNDKQIQTIVNAELNSSTFQIKSPINGVITNIDIKEGDYVMEGGSIFQVSDYSNLWAETQVFVEDLNEIKENVMVSVYFPGIPELKVKGKISFVGPELSGSSQINIVRVDIPNKNEQLKVGMQVNVSVLLNKKTSLAIPTDAVIVDGKGASVWKKTGHNLFQNVMVTTGIETNDYIQITGGLNSGDIVVVSGAYLLSSEYLFKKGTSQMESHQMSNMK